MLRSFLFFRLIFIEYNLEDTARHINIARMMFRYEKKRKGNVKHKHNIQLWIKRILRIPCFFIILYRQFRFHFLKYIYIYQSGEKLKNKVIKSEEFIVFKFFSILLDSFPLFTGIYQSVDIYLSKLADRGRWWSEGSLFKSYYTEV